MANRFRSPERFYPKPSLRVPSPSMTPGGRRGRTTTGSSEEARLRDLSPSVTLRAFTETPLPYDTSLDEYKIFGCIESLTAAEKDLGTRVAKAAQRLKSWCQEIEQWGWTGSFEPPSDDVREQRRRSIEMRIREHIRGSAPVDSVVPLEYWGSMLSVDVQAHETRLDEIGDELVELDVDELKSHVLDIHGSSRSRPSSAGFEASRPNYTPMDDFSFLITQTLLSALPYHFQLKDRVSTWSSRVSVLRAAPRYLDDLKTTQKAMNLGWDAIEPPTDTSDAAFEEWREAVATISSVLQGKVSDLGQRLDRMLDSLEGSDDCLPEHWIDIFEGVEGDYGRWETESRRRVIDFGVRRKSGHAKSGDPEVVALHSDHDLPECRPAEKEESPTPADSHVRPRSVTAFRPDIPVARTQSLRWATTDRLQQDADPEPAAVEFDEYDSDSDSESEYEEGDTVVHNELDEYDDSLPNTRPGSSTSQPPVFDTVDEERDPDLRPRTPESRRGSNVSGTSQSSSLPSVSEESPSVRTTTGRPAKAPRPPLNATMGKRRQLNIVKDEDLESAPWPPTKFSSKHPNSAEELDRKISEILTNIPAQIRLTSGTGAEVVAARPARGSLSSKGSKGYLRATRSMTGMKGPEITLSPAKSALDAANPASGRKSTAAMKGDNDIKLYHLTQPGIDKPVKLFIRRVGVNGERVMVRVGGGWSDLGEYLRQYAEHHGRRAISESKFEINGLQVTNPGSRPGTAMSSRDRRFSGNHTTTGSPSTTPQRSGGVLFSRDEPPVLMGSLTSTPVGASSGEPPSTDSSHHSWTGIEVGLAGPTARKLELSGEKLEWIEGMMKQARNVSAHLAPTPTGTQLRDAAEASRPGSRSGAGAESKSRPQSRNGALGVSPRRSPRKSFGDLGKVGGTKRVFMKNGGLE